MSILQHGKLGGIIPNTEIKIRKKLGKESARLGTFRIGKVRNGARTAIGKEHHGIYQVRQTYQGRVSVRYNFPKNKPYTTSVAQEASRQKLANAVSEWQNLTNEAKESYNKRAIVKRLSGYMLFIKEYMLS